MNASQLLTHFDRLAEAPGAVPRLRRFILDLAVRGKLVAQDAGDEPATALLKKIENEIARLVKIGEMRKPKALPPIEAGTEPFDAPTGWRWVRIRQVTSDRGQTTPAGDFTYIDVGSINKEAGVLGEHKVLSASDAPSRARKVVGKGDVLYSCVRPTLLNIAVVEDEIKPRPIASTAFAVLNGFGLVLPRYLWIALRSPYLEAIVESGMRGQAYPAINDAEFALLPLALPPLAEQHRIVAKVDELMALCDQLEAAQQERERHRDRLAAASLQRLNQPAADTTPEAQREHARFHLHHLPLLTTRPEHIKAMRQTIHNLAVRGRLVMQTSSEQSAHDLLKQMQAQKTLLIEDGTLPKSKNLAQIGVEEMPSVLPSTWCWTRIESVCAVIVDCPHSTATFIASGVICLDTNSFKAGAITPHKIRYVSEDTYQERIQRLEPQGGDLIFAREGSVGESVIVPDGMRCCLGQRVMLFRPLKGIVPSFFQLALSEPSSLARLLALHKGIGAKHVNVADMRNALLPLPPLAEQHRIVAKVDELMALCDQLEAQLTTTQTDSRRLLEAVLEAALAPA